MADAQRNRSVRQPEDLTGRRFGMLVVVNRSNKARYTYWNCRCDCGAMHVAESGNLTGGSVQSCGCLRGIANRARLTTHGGRNTAEYRTWRGIKLRCLVPTDQHYPDYGARGIIPCSGVATDFSAFLNAVGTRPSRDHSIDRIDNDRGYDCGACEDCLSRNATLNMRWADKYQQAQNRRGCHKITYNGETLCLAEWSRRTGLSSPTLRERLLRGWTVHDALTLDNKEGRKRRFMLRRER